MKTPDILPCIIGTTIDAGNSQAANGEKWTRSAGSDTRTFKHILLRGHSRNKNVAI